MEGELLYKISNLKRNTQLIVINSACLYVTKLGKYREYKPTYLSSDNLVIEISYPGSLDLRHICKSFGHIKASFLLSYRLKYFRCRLLKQQMAHPDGCRDHREQVRERKGWLGQFLGRQPYARPHVLCRLQKRGRERTIGRRAYCEGGFRAAKRKLCRLYSMSLHRWRENEK